ALAGRRVVVGVGVLDPVPLAGAGGTDAGDDAWHVGHRLAVLRREPAVALDVVDGQRAGRAAASPATRAGVGRPGGRRRGGEVVAVLVAVRGAGALVGGGVAGCGGVGAALVDHRRAVSDEINDVGVGSAVRGGLAGERRAVV